jgi:RimJ/RimL family protein N-acetyltransferase
MHFSVLGPLKEEQIKQFVRKEISVFQEKGMAILAVLCKVSGSLIGYCGVHWLNIDGEVLPELTYRFAFSFWGKGFATEAAHAVKTYSIEKKQMSNLVSIIDPENVRSIRVAEKLGAVFWKETKYEHLHIRVYQHTL